MVRETIDTSAAGAGADGAETAAVVVPVDGVSRIALVREAFGVPVETAGAAAAVPNCVPLTGLVGGRLKYL